MAFTLPVFNLAADFWDSGNLPNAGAAQGNIQVQLYIGSKGFLDIQPINANQWVPPIWIRTDGASAVLITLPFVGQVIFGIPDPTFGDVKFYKVRWWDTLHLGFPNEYVQFLCEQCDDAGVCPDPLR